MQIPKNGRQLIARYLFWRVSKMKKQTLITVLKETAETLRGIKFNPYHDSEGRFSTGGSGGPKLAPDTGGGTGGGGKLGGSPGDKESYNDRIEGTQKEADREVKRAEKVVATVKAALSKLEAKTSKKQVATLKAKHEECVSKISELKKQKEATMKRIEALKAQLKKSVQKELNKEILTLKDIINKFRVVTKELYTLMDEVSKL
jgi:F0F1-type ATP synthase membrane subunit b/b'